MINQKLKKKIKESFVYISFIELQWIGFELVSILLIKPQFNRLT